MHGNALLGSSYKTAFDVEMENCMHFKLIY